MKPVAESCLQNQEPIYQIIKDWFTEKASVLEVGSGTGQHACYFAERLPHLLWQTSDQAEYHAGIHAWLDDYSGANVLRPLLLDVTQQDWGISETDYAFSANTCHIMSWPMVVAFFEGLGRILKPGGVFALYGPFNINQQFTAASNERFEQWLKSRDPHSGIRDIGDLEQLAQQNGMSLIERIPMPADNFILIFRKA